MNSLSRSASPQAMGCTPFQRSLRNSESWVNDCAGRGDVKALQQAGSAAGAEFPLTGPHANPGAAAQVEQGVDRQVFHRVFHFTGSDGFTFADQATVLALSPSQDGVRSP